MGLRVFKERFFGKIGGKVVISGPISRLLFQVIMSWMAFLFSFWDSIFFRVSVRVIVFFVDKRWTLFIPVREACVFADPASMHQHGVSMKSGTFLSKHQFWLSCRCWQIVFPIRRNFHFWMFNWGIHFWLLLFFWSLNYLFWLFSRFRRLRSLFFGRRSFGSCNFFLGLFPQNIHFLEVVRSFFVAHSWCFS